MRSPARRRLRIDMRDLPVRLNVLRFPVLLLRRRPAEPRRLERLFIVVSYVGPRDRRRGLDPGIFLDPRCLSECCNCFFCSPSSFCLAHCGPYISAPAMSSERPTSNASGFGTIPVVSPSDTFCVAPWSAVGSLLIPRSPWFP